jgi:hypothetical protein
MNEPAILLVSGLIAYLVSRTLLGGTPPPDGYTPSESFRSVKAPGVTNCFALGQHVYSGSVPDGEVAFETLQKLGIKTIISVDGAKPDVEAARRHGIRYVHLPFGYDGIPPTNALYLVKAAQILPGPIYVHCHHGQHRGPAAAAVICEGVDGWSPGLAVEWLRTAGTATNYAGLYRSVNEFRPPSEAALSAIRSDFPSVAKTGGLVDAMVQIDAHFDTLKALQKSCFTSVPGHPDAIAANESLILFELFREAHRAKLGAKRGGEFIEALAKAEVDAENLHKHLEDLGANPSEMRLREEAGTAFKTMSSRCSACHRAFRD